MAERLLLPGFVDAHSHGFQRALRGRNEGRDFWAWRDGMLAEAERHTPDTVRFAYAEVYRELLAAGYTAIGEFHYLGFDEAIAAWDAAREAGVGLVLLYSAYARGGLERFRQESVGEYFRQIEELAGMGVQVALAPHSVRACPEDWLVEIGRYGERNGLPLHVHAAEQQREIEECLAEHGVAPIELLERAGCLSPRTTVVHATHASDHELDLLAASNARVCLCPTTEANLADGFAPAEGLVARGIPLCIGSDSNARIDPLEELRELEGIARRQSGRRDLLQPEELLAIGSTEGAAALGLESWPDVEVDLGHPALRGVGSDHVRGALLAGCGADVLAGAVKG
jgi:formimidoylglutamate deiminase